MRILLINPPKSPVNLIAHYAPSDIKAELNKFGLFGPPLSLCALAGNLTDYEVDIFDLKAEYDLGLQLGMDEAVDRKLAEFKPDIVGVSVLTSDYNRGCRILEIAKRFSPDILTIAGGVHASLAPNHFDLPYIDIVVTGHGKMVFRDIVLARESGKGFQDIPNIYVRSDGNMKFTKSMNIHRNSENMLSHIPSNRKLIRKYDDAYRVGVNKERLTFIESSYGCPNKCTFCSIWPVNRGEYINRSIDDVIKEIKTLDGYEVIRFVDANIMGDFEYADRLFDRLIKEKVNKKLVMDIRSDTAVYHPELIEKAAKAGLGVAIVGMESENDEDLAFYNKESSRDIVLKSIDTFNKNGIDVRGLFIVNPDYEEKDFKRLNCFLTEHDLKHAAITVMTPFPGTPLYDEVKDKITIHDLDYYNLFNSVFKTKLPEEEFYCRIAEICRMRKSMHNFK
ncbi:MAG TPA: radical SAM protein [Clostridia bacterium]|nr:radical SAM protein [Clostridia bacterium]